MSFLIAIHAAAAAILFASALLIRKRLARSAGEKPRGSRDWSATRPRDERRFAKAVIDSLPGIFYLYEYPSLKLVYWNANHETKFGFGQEELRGKSLFDWHAEEVRPLVREAVEMAMKEGSNAIEGMLRRKDGEFVPYLLTGTAFKAEGKDYLIGVGIDISERKKAESALERLNKELESRVAERTSQLETAMRDLKASQEQTLLAEKMADLGRLVAGLAHEINTPLGAILSASETSARTIGKVGPILDFYRKLPEADAAVFRALVRGIERVPELESGELRKKRKKLRTILEEEQIAGAVLLAEQLVEIGFGEGDEELRGCARGERFGEIVDAAYQVSSVIRSNYVVRQAAEKAAKVISALKTYGRSDGFDDLGTADVRAQLEEVLTIYHNRIKEGVEVLRSYGEVPPVVCYPDRLDQVWMNLIGNAIQAMGYKGKLSLSVRQEGDEVAVSIGDDGPGIPDHIKDRIFTPFFTTKKPGEGTGLGLDICKKILAQTGDSISFESGNGATTFTVRLHAAGAGGTR